MKTFSWMKIFIAVALIVLLTFVYFYFYSSKKEISYKTTSVAVGNAVVNAEIADTDALRTLGLSGRESLGKDKGMLFVFDTPGDYGFWMKDMNFSIDIVWASENKIIYIEKSVSPTTYPKAFKPSSPAQFVLELPAGFCDTHNLKVGDFFSPGFKTS